MKKVGKIPWVLGGLYAVWCVFVYFCADHEWWPIFLHYPLFPVSRLIEFALAILVDKIPDSAGEITYVAFDRISGLIYLFAGFVWFFFLGLVMQRGIRYFSHKKNTFP